MEQSVSLHSDEQELGELASLQTAHVDAANGYQAGLDRADEQMTPVLSRLEAVHRRHGEELSGILLAHGGKPDTDGSWMSLVHEAVMTMRGVIDDLDTDIVDGLIDGEDRILEQIETVLGSGHWNEKERQLLEAQRERIGAELAALRKLKSDA